MILVYNIDVKTFFNRKRVLLLLFFIFATFFVNKKNVDNRLNSNVLVSKLCT